MFSHSKMFSRILGIEEKASFLRQVFLQVAIVPISAEMARKMTVFPSA
jgi:hypothetical protein